MPTRALPSGFAFPHKFSISLTCGFLSDIAQERVFMSYLAVILPSNGHSQLAKKLTKTF